MAEDTADSAVEALLKRAEKAEMKRDAMVSLMREVYKFTMPERDNWSSYGIGQDRTNFVYDSSGVSGASRFANRLQMTVFPAGQRWSMLSLPEEKQGSDEAKRLQIDLQEATKIMFRHVHASNFDAEISPVCHDIGAGVGIMLVENGRYGQKRSSAPLLRCQAVPPALVAFDEGPWGTVEGVFFTQTMAGRLITRTYPDAKLPKEMSEVIAAKPEDDVTLLQATTYDAKKLRWVFQVIDRAGKEVLVTRSYRTNPWIIIRWTKVSGESHGRGPLMQALPDIRVANKLMELMLISGSFDADPTYTAVDDGVVNTDVLGIVPGQIVPVRSNGGTFGPSIKMLERPGSLQFSDALLDRMHTRVRQLLFDNPLPPEVQVGLTATEIVERMRLFQQDTGSFGRLHQDAVVPLTLRFVDILEEAGEFPPDRFPKLFEALRGNQVQTRVVSPIARAQDQADVQVVMSMIGGATRLGEFGVRMLLAAINPEKAGVYIANRSGVPAELIPSESETTGRLKAAAEAEQNRTLATSPVVAQVAGAVAGGAVAQGAPQQQEAA